MKTVNEIEVEVTKEMNDLEDKAFELFVKEQIKKRIIRTEDVKSTLNKLKDLKEEQTIEYFENLFKGYSPSTSMSNKEYYSKLVTEGKNK